MHIDTANNVPVADKATFAACPISALGLMLMLADRTLATCASFRASEALDASLCRFMCEVVDVLAILPQGHPLVVMTPAIAVADTVGIAHEEGANLSLLTEVHHFARGFVAQIADATFCPSALLVLGPLQSSPTTRTLLAPRLLFRKLAQHLGSLSFERTNATACDDHRLTCVGRDCCQMDFTQVNCRMDFTRGRLFGCFDAHMQLEAIIPDQATCAAIIGQI
jgi:hypothetical protein